MPAPTAVAIGIDVGGSATRALIVDAAGRCLGSGRSAGGNPTAHPPGTWSRVITEALHQALARSGPADVRSVVAGVAGGGALADGQAAAAFKHVIRSATGCSCPVRVTGDVVVAFAAGTPRADGTVLVAGTGAAAAALRNRTPVAEADGHGWLLGDAGSGFWIGREAVRAVLAELDGHGPVTRLRPLVAQALLGPAVISGSMCDMRLSIIRAANARPPVELASLAPLVSRSARAGDEVALRIARDAVTRLVRTVEAIRPPGASTPVVVTGGIAAGDHLIAELLSRELQARWPGCARAVHDGVAGAAWLALTLMPGTDPEQGASLHRVISAQMPRPFIPN